MVRDKIHREVPQAAETGRPLQDRKLRHVAAHMNGAGSQLVTGRIALQQEIPADVDGPAGLRHREPAGGINIVVFSVFPAHLIIAANIQGSVPHLDLALRMVHSAVHGGCAADKAQFDAVILARFIIDQIPHQIVVTVDYQFTFAHRDQAGGLNQVAVDRQLMTVQVDAAVVHIQIAVHFKIVRQNNAHIDTPLIQAVKSGVRIRHKAAVPFLHGGGIHSFRTVLNLPAVLQMIVDHKRRIVAVRDIIRNLRRSFVKVFHLRPDRREQIDFEVVAFDGVRIPVRMIVMLMPVIGFDTHLRIHEGLCNQEIKPCGHLQRQAD